jgi:hypothetical protein
MGGGSARRPEDSEARPSQDKSESSAQGTAGSTHWHGRTTRTTRMARKARTVFGRLGRSDSDDWADSDRLARTRARPGARSCASRMPRESEGAGRRIIPPPRSRSGRGRGPGLAGSGPGPFAGGCRAGPRGRGGRLEAGAGRSPGPSEFMPAPAGRRSSLTRMLVWRPCRAGLGAAGEPANDRARARAGDSAATRRAGACVPRAGCHGSSPAVPAVRTPESPPPPHAGCGEWEWIRLSAAGDIAAVRVSGACARGQPLFEYSFNSISSNVFNVFLFFNASAWA